MPIRPLLFLSVTASAAFAIGGPGEWKPFVDQSYDDYGMDLITIKHAGNRAAWDSERVFNDGEREKIGRVNYRYRISRVEVTVAEHIEFLNAFDQYWVADGESRLDTKLVGHRIVPSTLDPGSSPGYHEPGGYYSTATSMSWRVAARYVNWLHNGKGTEREDFETGVYDVSTFGDGPNGTGYTDQFERSPGAKYWIPSLDEWIKAMHFDPDRYGEGEEGYWKHKGGQDTPLTPGFPWDGGQTNAGDSGPDASALAVGLYDLGQSPLGIYEGSGGQSEWTETVPYILDEDAGIGSGGRYLMGSEAFESFFSYRYSDTIDDLRSSRDPPWTVGGLRIATVVPTPASASFILLFAAARTQRRR